MNRTRTIAVAAVLALTVCVGCGEAGEGGSSPPVPRIGAGPRYRPPPAGRSARAGKPIGRLPCTHADGRWTGVHLEVFANGLDLVIPAGIGVAPPRVRKGAYVSRGRCSYPVRTLEPTGLIEVAAETRVTLGEFFEVWGQPLSKDRVVGFRARPGEQVEAFVNGMRWHADPRAIPLSRHAAIVLEIGGYFPPTRRYVFPSDL